MNIMHCTCPFCRALAYDGRPPAHYIEDLPTVRELTAYAEVRRKMPGDDGRRRSRRGPVPR